MEFTILNKSNEKHHITIDTKDAELHITIIRLRTAGGIPKIIRLNLESDVGFSECLKKINNLARLDDEMYILLAEHTN